MVEETHRAVIREQVAAGGKAVPWSDYAAYAELCAKRDVAIYDGLAGETGRVFFDRGIVDSYGAPGVAPSPFIAAAVRSRRYNRRVFVFPPWREIYATDGERKQGWEEAEATFEVIRKVLISLDYEPTVVPIGTVEERLAFVLANVA